MNWEALALIVAAIVGPSGVAVYFQRKQPRGTRENTLIDQYQEKVAEQDRHAAAQDVKIATLEHRMDALVHRERLRDDYIMLLRQHIAENKPPPPPPFPPGLVTP